MKKFTDFKKNIFLKFLLILKILFYFGFKFKCNNCNQKIRKFLSINEVLPKENYDLTINGRIYKSENFETFNQANFFCPICRIPDKGRFILKYLETLENLNKMHVLHISPETGIQKKLNLILSPSLYVASSLEDPNTRQIDLQNPIKDKFDLIIVSHILEHIPDDDKALLNIYDALNPLGKVLFLVPIHKEIDFTFQDNAILDPNDRKLAYGLEDHVRQYGKVDFQKLIKKYFKLELFESKGKGYNKYGITEDSILYVGVKSDV